jgi:hypothetical protein
VACNAESFRLEGDVLMSDPVSDPSPVDRLREQLIEATNAALEVHRAHSRDDESIFVRCFCGHVTQGTLEGHRRDVVGKAQWPLIAAFGDAREAAGREQGRQDAAEETEAARRWLAEQGARPTMADVERLRGSGVAVQPTLGKQP